MSPFPFVVALLALQGQGLIPAQHLPSPPAPDAVLVKVNGELIKVGDVRPFLWDWRGSEVLEDLISYQLLLDEAKKEQIDVPEIEVLKRMDDQMQEMKQRLGPGQDTGKAMRQQGFPESRLYLRVKGQLILERLADKQFNPKDFVKVSTMVFPTKSAAASDLADALKKASEAAARLAKGEKWEAVLKDTQSNSKLVSANGLLGWRKLSAFPAPAMAELAGSKAGKVTEPVQTSSGIQFFRLEAVGADAKPDELKDLKDLFISTATQDIMQKLLAGAKIERLWGSTSR